MIGENPGSQGNPIHMQGLRSRNRTRVHRGERQSQKPLSQPKTLNFSFTLVCKRVLYAVLSRCPVKKKITGKLLSRDSGKVLSIQRLHTSV